MSPVGGSLTAMRRAVLKRFATRRFEPVPPRLPASERFQDCFSLYPGPTEALRLPKLFGWVGGRGNRRGKRSFLSRASTLPDSRKSNEALHCLGSF